jgi:hypothetical protein
MVSFGTMKTAIIIKKILQHARPEILKHFRADSCIASTAVGVDVLTQLGIVAEPLPVRTLIFNTPFANRLSDKNFTNYDQVENWTKEDGSYSVGIGFGVQQPNKWAGHLVVLIEKQFVLDLSIDQANRPQYNIILEPFCVEIDEKFLSGSPKVFKLKECIVRMDVLTNNDYILSPDWIFSNRRKQIVNSTLKIIQEGS